MTESSPGMAPIEDPPHEPEAAEGGRTVLVNRILNLALIVTFVVVAGLLGAIVYTALRPSSPGPQTFEGRNVILAEAAADEDPTSSRLQLAAASANLSIREYDRALTFIERVYDIDSNDPEARLLEGDIYQAMGDVDRARSIYEELAQSNAGSSVEASIRLAVADRAAGDIEAAIARLEYVLVASPTNASVLVALGEIHLGAGRTEEARDAFSKALEFVPDMESAIKGLEGLEYGPAKYDLAKVAWMRGDQETAKDLMEEAIRLAPEIPWLHVAYGDFYEMLGERSKARAAYERALDLDPDNQEAAERLAEF